MGKLINGINGHLRGKVGNIVGPAWKGIPYVIDNNRKKISRGARGDAAAVLRRGCRVKFFLECKTGWRSDRGSAPYLAIKSVAGNKKPGQSRGFH